jgi:hypothetical protein
MIVIISFSLEKLEISSSVCCLLRAFSSDVLIIFNILLRNINKLTVNDSFLGSGLIDHIQKMTIAAITMADMKVWAQRS